MEATITPIEDVLPNNDNPNPEQETTESRYLPPDFYQQQEYYQPQPPVVMAPTNQTRESKFPEFDKLTYVVIFIAFIVGFFMGKSSHPIILKSN